MSGVSSPTLDAVDISLDLDSGGHLAIRGVEEDGSVTNADVELRDTDGQRRSATVLTQPEIGRLMETWKSTGECHGGAFFRVPDLIIVREPSREFVIGTFAELERTGEHRHEVVLLNGD